MQKKVTYIISNINKALAFEWIATHLDAAKFKLDFILLNPADSVLENYLHEHLVPVKRVTYRGKRDIAKAILQVRGILKKNKPDVVHTHLFDANIVGLSAAWLCRVPKRIHTRHHSTYHHVYHPNAVKYDKLANSLSTDIVAISKTSAGILRDKENVPSKKIHLIHHGFMLNSFSEVSSEAVKEVNAKYNPANAHPVIGVISRYTEWKGIQFIIPAFQKLLEHYPDALLVLANADGDYKNEIQSLLKKLPQKNYVEIRFENNLFALYKLFDLFVHAPVDDSSEAFGQTYVEALAAGIPSVFTLSGIANEFISDHRNAIVVPYKNSEAIYTAIVELLANKNLKDTITAQGKKDVEEKFGLNKMIHLLEELYLS